MSALTSDHSASIAAGTTVTWTATATGGVAPLQYKFWAYDPSIGWSVIQDYGSANTTTWTPLKPGTYDLQVWVRAAGSTATYDAWLGRRDGQRGLAAGPVTDGGLVGRCGVCAESWELHAAC